MVLPEVYRVRQTFERARVKDIPLHVRAELEKLSLKGRVKPGQSVAITAGSRGIANISLIIKTVIDVLKELDAVPFIFPAMGSHGRATPEGQTDLLAHHGITETSMDVPIVSSMDVAEIGKTSDGIPVYVDRNALQADHIIVINRIRPHTKFKASIESGLMKMMAIGMGKQKGAEYYHKAALGSSFEKIIVDVARCVMERAPILMGLAIVENGYDETAHIVALRPQEIEAKEKDLLVLAKEMMPKLPFNEIDLLIVDELGKEISGTGIDPNVTGRNRDLLTAFPHPTKVKRLFVRDLTAETEGNALGIGLADVTTRRLVEKIDTRATYMNCITAISLEKASIPMYFDTDREAIGVALGSVGLTPPELSRIVRIRNTLVLEEVEVSAVYADELHHRPDLEILRGPYPLPFDAHGNLEVLQVESTRRGDV